MTDHGSSVDAAPEAAAVRLTIGELAALAGISVRTLHHYDELGLLEPAERGASGRRTYGAAEVERLQRILGYRALELPLEEIGRLLDDPSTEPTDHLRRQLQQLDARIDHLRRVRDAVRFTLEADDMQIKLTPAERLEVFGDHDPAEHAAEAKARWGATDAYRESARRAKQYSKDDWLRIKTEQEAIGAAFVAALHAGEAPTATVAMDIAERARLQIDAAFYPCSHEMHRGLAEFYVSDPRFAAHFEEQAEGLAEYVAAAIHANADRAAGR